MRGCRATFAIALALLSCAPSVVGLRSNADLGAGVAGFAAAAHEVVPKRAKAAMSLFGILFKGIYDLQVFVPEVLPGVWDCVERRERPERFERPELLELLERRGPSRHGSPLRRYAEARARDRKRERAAAPCARRASGDRREAARVLRGYSAAAAPVEANATEGSWNWVKYFEMVTELEHGEIGVIMKMQLSTNPWPDFLTMASAMKEEDLDFGKALKDVESLREYAGRRGFITLYTTKNADQLGKGDGAILTMQPTSGRLADIKWEGDRVIPEDSRLVIFLQVLRAVCEMREAGVQPQRVSMENVYMVGNCMEPSRCAAVLCDLYGTCSLPGGRWPVGARDSALLPRRPPSVEAQGFDDLDLQRDVVDLGFLLYKLIFEGRVAFWFNTHEAGAETMHLVRDAWTAETDVAINSLAETNPKLADLMRGMLARDSLSRMTAHEALERAEVLLSEVGLEETEDAELRAFADDHAKIMGWPSAEYNKTAIPRELWISGTMRVFVEDMSGLRAVTK